jgi:hypothetical protein
MGIVRKIAMGLLATVVLAVAGYLALALLVALVNAASSGPEEPSYNDDGLYEDHLDQRGQDATDELRRQQCEEAREDIPGLTC